MSESWNVQLEQYLDGLLQGPELSAFEELMRRDQRVREAVELQRKIDDSLRRRCAIPQPPTQIDVLKQLRASGVSLNGSAKGNTPAFTSKADNVSPSSASRLSLFVRRYAAAAIVLLAVCIAATYYYFAVNAPTYQHAKVTFDSYYHRKIEGGYQPAWVCKDDQEFADRFRTRFGQALVMDALPQGMSCAGLDYTTAISFDTVTVLLKDGDAPIIVFIDRRASDAGVKNSDRHLNVFRREVGNLVLYELSPFDNARALELFHQPTSTNPSTTK